jgi:hypothetical protein
MTTLNVNLSPALQQTLGQPGVYAYAVYFDSNHQNPTAFDLASGGTANPTTSLELPFPYVGGKVYFIIQSVDAGSPSNLFGPGGAIQQEADLNWQNAAANDFRFDSFEVTLQGNAGDVGNLTEINGFGIPMNVTVAYQDGDPTQTRGYGISGNEVFQQIASFSPTLVSYPYSAGPLFTDGLQRMALSPAEAEGQMLPGAGPADWTNYINYLETLPDKTIRIAGFFNGAASADAVTIGTKTVGNSVYHNPGFYAYDLSFITSGVNSGYFLLKPAANSQIKGAIQISPEALANSIYSTIGDVNILSPTSSGTYDNSSSTYLTMNTGANNEWGASIVKFLVGFVGGYYGGSGGHSTPSSAQERSISTSTGTSTRAMPSAACRAGPS